MKRLLFILILLAPTLANAQALQRWERIKPISAQVAISNPTGADLLLIEDVTDGTRKSIRLDSLLNLVVTEKVTLTGTPNYITMSGQEIKRDSINLSTDVKDTLQDEHIEEDLTINTTKPIFITADPWFLVVNNNSMTTGYRRYQIGAAANEFTIRPRGDDGEFISYGLELNRDNIWWDNNTIWHAGNLSNLSDLNNDLVNNSTLTLQRNGSSIGSFTLNQPGNETFNFIDENTTYTSSDFDHDQLTNFLQSEHFTQAEINIGVSQINDFTPGNIDLDFVVLNGNVTNTEIQANAGIYTPNLQYSGINYLRATGTATILSTPSTSGTIYLRPQGDAVSTNQGTYDYNGNLSIANSIAVNGNIVWHAGNFTPSSKQDNITLTTTGNSGAATFGSNILNVPNYTLTGLGGFPLTDLQDGTVDLDVNSILIDGKNVILSDGTNADYFVYGTTNKASSREDFLNGSVNKKAGFYWSSTSANAPTPTTYGYIHIPLSTGDSYAFELAGRESRYFLRSLTGGVYGSWGEIWHSGNSNNTSTSWAVAADPFDSSWNGLQQAAPKDAIYDRMENTNYMSSKGFWTGTQSAYDALGSYDSNTIYFIED